MYGNKPFPGQPRHQQSWIEQSVTGASQGAILSESVSQSQSASRARVRPIAIVIAMATPTPIPAPVPGVAAFRSVLGAGQIHLLGVVHYRERLFSIV
jgi:hypothetical protein